MTDAKVLSFATKPEGEAEASAAKPKPPSGPTLNPNAPYDNAGVFIQRHCMVGDDCVLWHWQGSFYRWSGHVYEPVPDELMRGQVYAFLDGARKRSGDELVRFQPKPRNVSDVIDALKSQLALGLECQPPTWLGTRESAKDWVVFKNGIVNMLTEEVRPLTPNLWVHNALGFDWNEAAECPTWETFLFDVFEGDEESVQFLEEFMGYCMTEETRFQKGAMFIGPKRSGKGTISHVLRRLVGDPNYVGLSFNTWARGEKSTECLIGKRVGVFADVRFKQSEVFGANLKMGGLSHTSAELLLNIIGEDTVTIGRMYKAAWHGQLRLKLMIVSNEVPNLNDPTGVLPSRFIKLPFPVSFYGREDVNLRAKLEAELSGIAVRCVRAYGDLCKRGYFIQPATASVLEREVIAASDPFAAMALENFVPDPGGTVVKAKAYTMFESWCFQHGHITLAKLTNERNFGKKLVGVAGFEGVVTGPRGHGQPRAWLGMRLRTPAERKADDA
ncbi:DNA primase family protein [Bradyrhizobium embrapense]